MPTFKLDTSPQRRPSQFVKNEIEKDAGAHDEWVNSKKKYRNTLESMYLQRLKDESIRYKRGSLVMAVLGALFLVNRFTNFEKWFASGWDNLLSPVSIGMVAMVILFSLLDLAPYLIKSRMRYSRGYAVFCRELYWLSALVVVLCYAKGTAVEVIYAGIMVVLCGLLCWVNRGKRQYRPSKFVSSVLTVTRWGILGLQFMTVFSSKHMAEMILKFLSVFLGK